MTTTLLEGGTRIEHSLTLLKYLITWVSLILSLKRREKYTHAIKSVATKLKEPQIAYVIESLSEVSAGIPLSVLFRGKDLVFDA